MKRFALLAVLSLALVPLPSFAAQSRNADLFAVVVTRHGVRSISKPPRQYSWADWQPVAPSFLTARGYRLMTYMGQFYRLYLGAHGLPVSCTDPNVFMYADIDQRTLETGSALIEGMCGKPNAFALYHNADTTGTTDDPLFDATQWAVAEHRIDTAASREAVAARLPSPAPRVIEAHAADFATLQTLLNARCASTCEPVTNGDVTMGEKEGLSEAGGPVKTASTYAEDLFLEYAQCRPDAPSVSQLDAAMRLHVLAYEINSRNSYNSHVRGGTLFAHIVGMLEEKAHLPHAEVDLPDITRDNVVFFAGHDTQLGALGGILDVHWPLENGLVPDDNPPGGALMFELYRSPSHEYRVRMRFAYETIDQFRHYSLQRNGVASVPVADMPLTRLIALSRAVANQGLVRKEWTTDSDAAVALDPLVNPRWTQCSP